ncbi:GNAT family N-acetyltransferase [Vibrio rumoiensis]|uniref:GNAT family N-acetyltransferase n=1 Tax=Vibrio rumoiensis TaxID=76258 RepID=UPI000474AEC1|nr:N-acetyltransferase [Vibrio rumoiensis]
MDINIRAANAHDLVQLDELMFQLHEHHHQAIPEFFKTAKDIEQEKSIARYLEDPECLVYVATDSLVDHNSNIVGFISGHFCELTSSVSKPLPMGSIDEFFVVENYRQRGVAKSLCQHIEAVFFDYGVQQVFVEVWEFNGVAQSFYREMGFTHHIHWLRKSLI